MSYDLDFWKYKPGVSLDHQTTYERLSTGEFVNGLEDLPIQTMVERLSQVLSDWERLDENTWESDRGIIQVCTTRQFFRVDCSHGMETDDLNKIIEVAAEFECPLYDPQVGQRDDGT